MSSVSAVAATYVPTLEPAVARKRRPNDGERRMRPRRRLLSKSTSDATTGFGASLRPFWAGLEPTALTARATQEGFLVTNCHKVTHCASPSPCDWRSHG